ncbi:hypothetical protein SHIRM173S_10570 [Streptomyces hirsutus]
MSCGGPGQRFQRGYGVDAADRQTAAEQRFTGERGERGRVDPGVGEGGRSYRDACPVGAVGDLHGDGAAVGQGGDLYTLESVLDEQPGYGPHQGGDVPAGARRHPRVVAHRVGDPGLGGAGQGGGDPGGGAGEAVQGDGEQGCAAAVDGHPGDALPGEVLDGLGDRPLEGVAGVEVVAEGPAVEPCGEEHGGVLAGAVLGEPGGRAALARPGLAYGPAERQVRRVAQVVLGEPGAREDAPGAGEVPFLAGVAGGGEGDRLPSSGRPARTMATAWTGLSAERG